MVLRKSMAMFLSLIMAISVLGFGSLVSAQELNNNNLEQSASDVIDINFVGNEDYLGLVSIWGMSNRGKVVCVADQVPVTSDGSVFFSVSTDFFKEIKVKVEGVSDSGSRKTLFSDFVKLSNQTFSLLGNKDNQYVNHTYND